MNAQQALAKTSLFSDNVIYTMISLPSRGASRALTLFAEHATPFISCIIDKDEISLVVPLDLWRDVAPRLTGAKQSGKFRLITFELVLDFSLVGFMALVSQLLADANISLMAISAYSRDHILVPANKFTQAWNVLENSQRMVSS